MHTRKFDSTVFNFNSDLSGDVHIRDARSDNEIKVPGRVLLDFVAEWVVRQKISALEDDDPASVLGVPVPPLEE